MKNLLLLLLVIPFLSVSAQTSEEKLIGKWAGQDKNEIGYFIFQENGFAAFELQGQVFGGEEFEFRGMKAKMTYKIIDNANPIQLDLVVKLLESDEENKLFCILEFIDDDTIKLALSFNETRPTEFNGINSIVFKREK